jgi:hypothetical protein
MCSSTGTSNSVDLRSHYITQESHLEFIISTLCSRRLIHCFISILERCTQLMGFHTFTCAQPQARLTQQIFFLTALHRRIIWSSSQLSVRRRPPQRSSPVSDRNHTPISEHYNQVWEDVWLMDSGASKHMTGFKQNLVNYRDKKFNVKVELGDDGT